MAIYKLTHRQSVNVQQAINVYYFVSSGVPAAVTGSFALADAFGAIDTAGLFPPEKPFQLIRDFQSVGVVNEEVMVENLYDPVDFYTRPFPSVVTGAVGEDTASPFLAYGLQSNRVRTDIRRGSKRYAGVTEGGLAGSGTVASGTLASVQALGDALSVPLEYDDEGTTLTFTSAILSFMDFTNEDGKTYKVKYPTVGEQLSHAAVGVSWNAMPIVRSQTSRQYGRGA